MINSFKPQKAKTYGKYKLKKIHPDKWIVSTKYDGHQIFIVKLNGIVSLYTSGCKSFSHSIIEKEINSLPDDNFILIGEFLYDCDGKLYCREKSAILTTFRTNFNKNISNNIDDENKSYVMVFDRLSLDIGLEIINKPAIQRLSELPTTPHVKPIEFCISSFDGAKHIADELVSKGWEGVMCLHRDSMYHPGKRVHHAIKIKPRLTADLLCIGTEKGEGRLKGLIGALILKDMQGRVCKVGSGLNDSQRALESCFWEGKVIEIEYEKIDSTYIQPIFKCVRDDKQPDEID